jgi:hypothetical protein
MALLGRIIVILFALWLATIAAGLVWSIGLLGPQWQASGDLGDRVVFWGATFLASGITATLIFLPALIAVVLTEAFSIRSLLVYAAGGAALTFLAYQGAGFGRGYEESIDRPPPPVSRDAEIAGAAGAAFGLVYWMIAGRRAGVWRNRPPAPPIV